MALKVNITHQKKHVKDDDFKALAYSQINQSFYYLINENLMFEMYFQCANDRILFFVFITECEKVLFGVEPKS